MSEPMPPAVELVVSLGAIDLPAVASCVYLLWDADDNLLYVGESGNALRRLGDHLGSPGTGPHVRRISLVPCRDETERRALEAWLIAHYQPPLNQAGTDRDPRREAKPLRIVPRTFTGDRELAAHADEVIRAALAEYGEVTPAGLHAAMAGGRSRSWAYDYLAGLAGRGLLARLPGEGVTYAGAGEWARAG